MKTFGELKVGDKLYRTLMGKFYEYQIIDIRIENLFKIFIVDNIGTTNDDPETSMVTISSLFINEYEYFIWTTNKKILFRIIASYNRIVREKISWRRSTISFRISSR